MGGFCPPLAHFDGPDNEEIRVPCAPSKKKTNAKLKNKGGCKPVTMDETADDQGSLNETVKTPPKKRKRNSNNDDSESQSADVKKASITHSELLMWSQSTSSRQPGLVTWLL